MENYRKKFIRNDRFKKIPSEADAVIKRATSGSRAIGSRPLQYTVSRFTNKPNIVYSRLICSTETYINLKLLGPLVNLATPPDRTLLQLSRESLLYANAMYYSQWCNWQGGRRANRPHGKLKCKNRSLTSHAVYVVFSILWLSVGCCVFAFLGVFRVPV